MENNYLAVVQFNNLALRIPKLCSRTYNNSVRVKLEQLLSMLCANVHKKCAMQLFGYVD